MVSVDSQTSSDVIRIYPGFHGQGLLILVTYCMLMRKMKYLMLFGFAMFFVLSGVRAAASERAASDRRSVELSIMLDPDMQSPEQDRNASAIVIDSLFAYSVRLDQNVSIPLYIYRGKTLKRTVYVWVEDSESRRVSSKQKFSLPERFRSYNVSANLSFSECLPDAEYAVVAEGLGLESSEKTRLTFDSCSHGQGTAVPGGKISYSVPEHDEELCPGRRFSTRVLISNPTGENLEIDAWSYVYHYSKCLSGEREQNRKTINVPEQANITFDLENVVDPGTAPGDYRLKIRLQRSDRKTPDEITLPVSVVECGETGDRGGPGGDSVEGSGSGSGGVPGRDSGSAALNIDESATGSSGSDSAAEKRRLYDFPEELNASKMDRVYRSSSAKAWGLAAYFIIGVLLLVLAALIMKRF